MKYFQLLYDFEHDHDYAFADKGDLKGVYRYDVDEGKPVLEWPDDVYFKYDLKYGATWTDYLANIYHWPMFSERMRELTEAIIPEGDIQYLPAQLRNVETGETNDTYRIANVLKVIDAIDMDASDYAVIRAGDIKVNSFKKYALKKERLDGSPVFKLSNDPEPIFMSETLVDVIRKAKLTGFDFLEVKVV